jgi:hypothetical protein
VHVIYVWKRVKNCLPGFWIRCGENSRLQVEGMESDFGFGFGVSKSGNGQIERNAIMMDLNLSV